MQSTRAQSHRRHRLNVTKTIDFVGPRHGLRSNDRRGRPSLKARRTGDNAFNRCNLGCYDRHMRRGKQWIFATRHIAACSVEWQIFMAENDAGQRLTSTSFMLSR